MRELKKLNEEKLIFFDIETARVVDELDPESQLYDSWDYKVNKDGKMTQQEVLDSFKREAGLYPEFSKVITIVAGKIIGGKIALVTFDNDSEVEILEGFNKMINRNAQDRLIGFVNIGFDTPFVFKRMIINGIQPNDKVDSSGLKPWEVEEVDLSKLWQGTSFARASLINIATAFGLPSPKDDISGADVGDVYWNEGESGLKRIAKYCRKDVVTTINIFKKMRLEEPLEIGVGDIEEIDLITSLFNGGKFGKEEKEQLIGIIKPMEESDRERAYMVLNSIVSGAKGKKTKLTKAHVKAIKKEVDGE